MNRIFEYVLKRLLVRKYMELREKGTLFDQLNEWEHFRAKAMHDLGFWDNE